MEHGRNWSPEGQGDPGVQAHCQRVAAWSRELASALRLSPSEERMVEQAALCHHFSKVAVDQPSRQRLLHDLKIEETAGRPALPEQVEQLLLTFWRNDTACDPSIAKLAAVLEMCDDFDQYFEAEPLAEIETGDESVNPSVETLFSYLQVTSRADVSRVIDRLPVFPQMPLSSSS